MGGDEGAGSFKRILVHQDLEVWRQAFDASMRIFELTKGFPKEELYSLTSQIRRSSRSVTANITEAWRKRRYEGAFVAKLNDAEAEAAETQLWLHYAVECGYVERAGAAQLYKQYDGILKTLVGMITHTDTWLLPARAKGTRTSRPL
jgi:four helix bundle protein